MKWSIKFPLNINRNWIRIIDVIFSPLTLFGYATMWTVSTRPTSVKCEQEAIQRYLTEYSFEFLKFRYVNNINWTITNRDMLQYRKIIEL